MLTLDTIGDRIELSSRRRATRLLLQDMCAVFTLLCLACELIRLQPAPWATVVLVAWRPVQNCTIMLMLDGVQVCLAIASLRRAHAETGMQMLTRHRQCMRARRTRLGPYRQSMLMRGHVRVLRYMIPRLTSDIV
ncbi:hypothetical protein EXIGLDRAFT_783969 [Exidia glandulosa HHB12029]|uniref:Uncharacterized protein n=1 Tax=Exidia glandulosa HHB12029 TaxID=1314781 RepID=A0A166MS60_EXIGL|nr:hypothetical protein EXIGLDRAFT_783969 [Exidia glandulosa HHB12029]